MGVMEGGVARGMFAAVSGGYRTGARSLWDWLGHTSWLIKPFGIIWVAPISLMLTTIGGGLYVLVVFDWLASIVDGIRNYLISFIENISFNMEMYKISYMISPAIIALMTPIVFLAGFIPKIGIGVFIHYDHNDDTPHPDGRYFRRVSHCYKDVLSSAWGGVLGHGFWFFPIALPVAMVMVPLAFVAYLLFSLMTTLDFISMITNWVREKIISVIDGLACGARNNIFNAVINPCLMISLLPIFITALLIPKISTIDYRA
jgi:hypothetical protein